MLFREMDDHDLLKVFAGLRIMVPRKRYRPAKTRFESIELFYEVKLLRKHRLRFCGASHNGAEETVPSSKNSLRKHQLVLRSKTTSKHRLRFCRASQNLPRTHPLLSNMCSACHNYASFALALGVKRQFFTPDGQVTMSLACH